MSQKSQRNLQALLRIIILILGLGLVLLPIWYMIITAFKPQTMIFENPAGTRVYVANEDSNNVSVIVTATNTVVATIPVGMAPLALGQFIGPAVVTPPARPDLNQHGLTGSWYEAVTSGQGVEVEVFANPTSGTGSTFVSWFTYDTVAGGPERQR